MIERKIQLCIGTDRAMGIRARLSLILVENGREISERYHSACVSPGDDLAELRAAIEADLTDPASRIPGAPWPAIPDEEWAKLEGVIGVLHTPAIVESHAAKMALAKGPSASPGDGS